MHYVYLCIAIIGEVMGTSALKASAGFSKFLPSMIVVLSYSIAFYFLSLAIKHIPVGIAYAIWSGAGIVLISLIGLFFFKQKLDLASMIGMLMIISGILIMNIFSKTL